MILQPIRTNFRLRPPTSHSCWLLLQLGYYTNGLVTLGKPLQRERLSWESQLLMLSQHRYGCKIPLAPVVVCVKLSLRDSSTADITAESVVVSCVGNILPKRNFYRIFTQLKSSVCVTIVLLVKKLTILPALSSLTRRLSSQLKRLPQSKKVWVPHQFLKKSQQ